MMHCRVQIEEQKKLKWSWGNALLAWIAPAQARNLIPDIQDHVLYYVDKRLLDDI